MYGKGGWAEQDRLSDSKMPQLRPGKLDLLFHISHLLNLHAGRWLYSLSLLYAIYTRKIYDATTIKSGCVIVWKAVMTVEAVGLRGSRR